MKPKMIVCEIILVICIDMIKPLLMYLTVNIDMCMSSCAREAKVVMWLSHNKT